MRKEEYIKYSFNKNFNSSLGSTGILFRTALLMKYFSVKRYSITP